MSNKALRNIFIIGSLFFFAVFLALTYDTMKQHDSRVPEITEEVHLGKMAWHKYDCIGCHTIFGNGSYFAPDLTKTTKNKPRSYLRSFLMDPKAVNAKAAMPTLGITAEEADNIITFLEWTSGVDTNGWPPEPVLASLLQGQSGGVALYQSNGCSACHIISGIGGTSGPELTSVGSRHADADWHIRHLKDPASVVQGSVMPPYAHLSDEDLSGIADYLLTLK
ncbi:MAG: cbb3-type cytochrome c oxidase subunit II [Thermodesulfovibrionales bacterium]|nr:cbb3-type cytochrome c oxidase subunit II [Thermodesulfovibrionales bacterium]